jgi:hypothetical protein
MENLSYYEQSYYELCKTNLAEIFQESGDYCLCCWQEINQKPVEIKDLVRRIIAELEQ